MSLALEDSGLPPELLTLEITESVLAHETDEVIRRLRQLKGLGVCLAIDDFGTGYSSLSYLRRFPIDLVKIDKTLRRRDRQPDHDEVALARAIVRLAHSLKIKTVAEGVELEGQARAPEPDGQRPGPGLLLREADGRRGGHGPPRRPHDAQPVGRPLGPRARGHQVRRRPTSRRPTPACGSRSPAPSRTTGSWPPSPRARPRTSSRRSSPTTSGSTSSDGGLIDLGPYMVRDGIDESLLTDATQAYTRRSGKRWALPMLADTYGLFVNSRLLAAAGVGGPPRTTDGAGRPRQTPDRRGIPTDRSRSSASTR